MFQRGSDTAAERWREQANHRAANPLKRGCVLVVDDDADGRDALAIVLRWAGHDVHLAADGEEALDLAARYQPELIFLDIGLPGRSGYEICRQLRLTPASRHVRIFALSAFSGELHDTRCAEAGFTGQLMKPIDPTELQQLAASHWQ